MYDRSAPVIGIAVSNARKGCFEQTSPHQTVNGSWNDNLKLSDGIGISPLVPLGSEDHDEC